jgi:hypothetical protein
VKELKKVLTKDLKKGETYWLNNEYTGWGGEPVKYVRTLKAPYFCKGDVEVRHASGVEFSVHKNSWLYGEDPNNAKEVIE